MSVPGPLTGLTVVELGGIGPTPFCGMVLADLGARVIVIARPGRKLSTVLDRGKEVWQVDLKLADEAARVHDAIAAADILIEGFRPGVAERLGFGPSEVAEFNPRLVYGRITGFGRTGPFAPRAGHDINYVSMSGALGAIGAAGGPPVPPLNLVADFGGGGLLLALGVVAAALRSRESGVGEVVDTAMVDGSALLMSMIYGFHAEGRWSAERGANLLDGGAPFYRTYECADGGHMAVGAIEPAFYATFVDGLGLSDEIDVAIQNERSTWPQQHEAFAAAFLSHERSHWEAVFGDVDACVTPVLGIDEAAAHPHNAARGTFLPIDGGTAPAPAPRFSPLTVRSFQETSV